MAQRDSELSWPQTLRAFEGLVDAVQHDLVHYAYCRLRNREDAEDVVQDALIRVYQDREKRGGATFVVPYLYRMVANRCTDLVRKRKRATVPLDESFPAEGTPGTVACDVERLLAGLPDRQAEVIRLRVFADLPFESIARVVGRSEPTVKSRFRYGLEKLRKVLRAKGAWA